MDEPGREAAPVDEAERPAPARGGRPRRGRGSAVVAVFTVSTFLGAGLVFLVQPMVAKMLLPLLGGSPAVWNTSMLFFQAALLAGYAYAHWSIRLVGLPRQAPVHLLVLLVPLLVLPIALPAGWEPPLDGSPTGWLLATLVVVAGLPFFAVTTASPLLQRWFAATDHPHAHDPYFLYAAGNAGSFLALLAYPVVVEPRLALGGQTRLWAAGYLAFVLLAGACVLLVRRATPAGTRPAAGAAGPQAGDGPALTWRRRLTWVGLAFIPSSLFLGTTQFLTTDIAAVPLLWVVPLSLYLLSFVVAFAPRGAGWLPVADWALPGLAVLTVVTLLDLVWLPIWLVYLVHLLTLFAAAVLVHGRLAADRPPATRLTEYFLLVAVGGVGGGLFNALVAPLAFDRVLEYPLVVLLAVAVRLGSGRPARLPGSWRLARDVAFAAALGGLLVAVVPDRGGIALVAVLAAAAVTAYVLALRPVALAGALALVVVAGVLTVDPVVHRERTFFGVYTVQPMAHDRIGLLHGTTVHGFQNVHPDTADVPLSYHHPDGPIGELYAALEGDPRLGDVGVLGLGVGTMAAYGEAGQRYTFYEIDPAVVDIATTPAFFTYLDRAEADVEIVLGDARLTLDRRTATAHGLLFMNAFTSDAIPVHLVTREAVELYLDRLAPGGLLVFNVSNRYLDVESLVTAVGADLGLAALARADTDEDLEAGRYASWWVLLARDVADFGALAGHDDWYVPAPAPGTPVWTDTYSNLLGVYHWD